MPVRVTLPDGSERDFPSHDVFTPSQTIGARSDEGIHTETPNGHPDYDFRAVIGEWRAVDKRR